MGHRRSFDFPEPVLHPPCRHLRSKAIYVTGNPDPPDATESGSHRYGCWCNRTLRAIGPDEAPVERAGCIVGRGCFEPR